MPRYALCCTLYGILYTYVLVVCIICMFDRFCSQLLVLHATLSLIYTTMSYNRMYFHAVTHLANMGVTILQGSDCKILTVRKCYIGLIHVTS